ncbi:MAG TPA: hypothetical protein VNO81_10770 [Candidatus Nitrosotenuis sp.]|nr:hypothetical protein [Candidatus Nitrosotenuis sp.]
MSIPFSWSTLPGWSKAGLWGLVLLALLLVILALGLYVRRRYAEGRQALEDLRREARSMCTEMEKPVELPPVEGGPPGLA